MIAAMVIYIVFASIYLILVMNYIRDTTPNPQYLRGSPLIAHKQASKNMIQNNINQRYSTTHYNNNNNSNKIDKAQSYILSSSPFDISTN